MLKISKLFKENKRTSSLKIQIVAMTTLLSTFTFAAPMPVDLSSWIENGFKGDNGAGAWTVQPGNDSVLQSTNGQPTVFFEAGSNAQGTSLSGAIEVLSANDDDFVGFFLGYQDGELNSTAADFWMIDWKQNDQTGALDGLALSHVSGDIANGGNANPEFWQHTGTVTEVQRALNLGSTGWLNNQQYAFDLIFTSTLIQVSVNDVIELSYSGNFTDGAFGFYNYSQSQVMYSGIGEESIDPCDNNPPGNGGCPAVGVSEPSSLALIGLSIIGFYRLGRKLS